jgi:hypothetical protein
VISFKDFFNESSGALSSHGTPSGPLNLKPELTPVAYSEERPDSLAIKLPKKKKKKKKKKKS